MREAGVSGSYVGAHIGCESRSCHRGPSTLFPGEDK